MGLTMSQRRAVTKTIATRYKRVDNGLILDELCSTTGWHRNHARKAVVGALTPKVVRPRKAREPRIWAGGRCGTAVLLSGAGCPDREVAVSGPGGLGPGAAPVRRAVHR